MARKPPMTNKEVLTLLYKAGYKTNVGVKKQSDCFSTEWDDKSYKRYNFSTGGKSTWSHFTKFERNYMIPLDIWKAHINKRFKPAFKVGAMVRVNQNSSRERQRNKWNQNVGDSQDFRHLGIGSGKEYLSEDMQDALGQLRRYSYSSHYNIYNMLNSRIVIGNDKYSPNVMAAIAQAKSYKHRGIQKPKRYAWERYLEYAPRDFLEFIKIEANGILGPKQLVNGYVKQVYVHFIYPRWNTKREGRYEIVFETGAKGIWTNDYMVRVYDTDYEVDENLMAGCEFDKTCSVVNCDHRKVHFYNKECDEPCFHNMSHNGCYTIYDYSRLFETTHGMALDLKEED
jgi:hypothetical protein